MRILIADDNQASRLLLSRLLEKLGYEVLSVVDGMEAWETLRKEKIRMMVTDWLMPNLDGLELCKRIRAADFPNYIYIIMLTSKDSKLDIIEGMEAGADDFIVKPFNREELNVRIRAGERVIRLEKKLEEHNRKLTEANEKVSEAYATIKKDLQAAERVQSSLLPEPNTIIFGVRFDWLFLPSTFIAGDIFNYFKLDEYHLGFYLLDVAGHGIPAALLSFTLSKILSSSDLKDNPLKYAIPEPPYYRITSPADVMGHLNQRFQTDDQIMQYFTIVYGIIDTRDGRTVLTQAGHPSPIFLQKRKETSLIGSGGYPVAMFPEAEYEEHEIHLDQGDRLILYSDGITECLNADDKPFTVKRLVQLAQKVQDQPLRMIMTSVREALYQWKGNDQFEDDVTLLAMEVV
ncbi:MAG: SpoIIE family protein phosphatase [Deltaproteobacteria bacterium]|nr:SpoIIE family protein phosphatase [Deltaproteobacteria bacterium]